MATKKEAVKYVDRLRESKQNLDEEYDHISKIASKELELKIANEEVALAKANERIRAAKCTYPMNADGVANALDEKALLERRVDQLKELYNELF